MLRARELRANGNHLTHREFAPLAGHLLLRTWDRAQGIHQAMLARGFEGHFRMLHRPSFGIRDAVFLVGWGALFLVLRFNNLPVRLEALLSGGLR
jgi:cobalt/nickel transport system permease protein